MRMVASSSNTSGATGTATTSKRGRIVASSKSTKLALPHEPLEDFSAEDDSGRRDRSSSLGRTRSHTTRKRREARRVESPLSRGHRNRARDSASTNAGAEPESGSKGTSEASGGGAVEDGGDIVIVCGPSSSTDEKNKISKMTKEEMCPNLFHCPYGAANCKYSHEWSTRTRPNIDEKEAKDLKFKCKRCPYLDCQKVGCFDAHSEVEISANNHLYKLDLCKFLPNCPNGDRCTFSHSEDEICLFVGVHEGVIGKFEGTESESKEIQQQLDERSRRFFSKFGVKGRNPRTVESLPVAGRSKAAKGASDRGGGDIAAAGGGRDGEQEKENASERAGRGEDRRGEQSLRADRDKNNLVAREQQRDRERGERRDREHQNREHDRRERTTENDRFPGGVDKNGGGTSRRIHGGLDREGNERNPKANPLDRTVERDSVPAGAPKRWKPSSYERDDVGSVESAGAGRFRSADAFEEEQVLKKKHGVVRGRDVEVTLPTALTHRGEKPTRSRSRERGGRHGRGGEKTDRAAHDEDTGHSLGGRNSAANGHATTTSRAQAQKPRAGGNKNALDVIDQGNGASPLVSPPPLRERDLGGEMRDRQKKHDSGHNERVENQNGTGMKMNGSNYSEAKAVAEADDPRARDRDIEHAHAQLREMMLLQTEYAFNVGALSGVSYSIISQALRGEEQAASGGLQVPNGKGNTLSRAGAAGGAGGRRAGRGTQREGDPYI